MKKYTQEDFNNFEVVNETHGDNLHAKSYLLWCEIIELNAPQNKC